MHAIKIGQTIRTRFTRDDLGELMHAGAGPCLSLFAAFPTAGRESLHQGRIQLKNLRARAETLLAAQGSTEAERLEILSPLDQILDAAETTMLQGRSLALFSAHGHAAAFALPVSLPSLVEVDARFRVDPLLPLLFEDGHFHLLALSLKSVRLWEVDRYGIRGIPLEGAPTSLRAAENFQDSEAYLSYHTGTPYRGARMFHGQGGGKGDLKEMKRDIRDFFQQVDHGVRAQVGPDAPLMLAGVKFLLPIYRAATIHPRLMAAAVTGNPENAISPDELHAEAWILYQAEKQREKRETLDRYRESSPGRTAAGVTDVVPLAHQGRVDCLFLRRGFRCPGVFDAATGAASPSPSGSAPRPGEVREDLVNIACLGALLGGGKVYVLGPEEMPGNVDGGGSDMAALCRY